MKVTTHIYFGVRQGCLAAVVIIKSEKLKMGIRVKQAQGYHAVRVQCETRSQGELF